MREKSLLFRSQNPGFVSRKPVPDLLEHLVVDAGLRELAKLKIIAQRGRQGVVGFYGRPEGLEFAD